MGENKAVDFKGNIDLDLSHNNLFKKLNKKHNQRRLKSLKLNSNKISELNIDRNLWLIVLSFNEPPDFTTTIIPFSCGYLLEINLSHNLLVEFLSDHTLKNMRNLKKLNLHDNKISKLDTNSLLVLQEIGMIEDLNLSSNKLTILPSEIGFLLTLKSLNLNNNELTELPVQITNLTLLYNLPDSFNIKGNKLIKPQQDIAQKGGLKKENNLSSFSLANFEAYLKG